MSDVTDEMVEAAFNAWDEFAPGWSINDELRAIVAAALAAAPTIDSGQWGCGNYTDDRWLPVWRDDCLEDGCPGPHRTLLLGPTVEAA